MPLLQKVLNKLNGFYYQQEYLCLAMEKMQQRLFAYLVNDKLAVIKDVTATHLFAGYKPLIFAFAETGETFLQQSPIIRIAFAAKPTPPGAPAENVVAILSLKKIHSLAAGNSTIFYYEGLHGAHNFIGALGQWAFSLNNKLYNKKGNNVYLDANLYKQVQIAYSLPRKISVATTGQNGLYNIFPTDLHGQADGYYIISLRTGGKACEQVMQTGKILLSDMPASSYKLVYLLGKNHMQPLKEKTALPLLSNNYSPTFNLPCAAEALRYKELQLQSSLQHGIHTLLLFKIVYLEELGGGNGTLAHIHNAYATWRLKHHIDTGYFLR